MSALADFRLIEISKLEELKEAAEIRFERGFLSNTKIDGYERFLKMNTTRLKDYKYPGYVFAYLLVFLKERKNIDLLTNEFARYAVDIAARRKNSTIIFNFAQKIASLEKLNVDNFTRDELIDFNTEFSNEINPDLAIAELEAIKSLKENMEFIVDDKSVLLLSIG